ncbi:HAD-IA family hydrolase [Kordiimonas laminariae]|uniref:HAD-IA family hydrolase n=1 Tax=Kordiimonas laminariae TaxID=2917717 RepID=UPI001FF13AF1|nr:HAD-IA family hydrolase [Kordiimonas laminariae]MCK0070424.1 HAD-IA family hydrolase [Kordiimonas laminariae]
MKVFSVQKILFDLDGTLVDTAADLHAATNHALRIASRPDVPLSSVRHLVGFGSLRLIKEGLKLTGGSEGIDSTNLQKEFLDFYTDNIAVHSAPYPYCVQTLTDLKGKGFELAVCTNKPERMAKSLLSELDLLKYFGAIVGGDSLPYKKPDARHLQDTATLLTGTGPTLMVGDASPDILGAKAANMPVVAVSYGFADTDIKALEPDMIIESLAILPDVVSLQSV